MLFFKGNNVFIPRVIFFLTHYDLYEIIKLDWIVLSWHVVPAICDHGFASLSCFISIFLLLIVFFVPSNAFPSIAILLFSLILFQSKKRLVFYYFVALLLHNCFFYVFSSNWRHLIILYITV